MIKIKSLILGIICSITLLFGQYENQIDDNGESLLLNPLQNSIHFIDINGNIKEYNNGIIFHNSYNSLSRGLIAYWSSQYENDTDSLTFNSTGDTIIYVSNDTVGLDDGQSYNIGNSMRFGDPNVGTIYTIIDTATTRDTVILNQNCIANIGDEFYVACIGTISDMSDNSYDAIQNTGVAQPQTLWFGTDSIRMKYDIDWYVVNDNGALNLPENNFSLCFNYNPQESTTNRRVLSNSISLYGFELYNVSGYLKMRYYHASGDYKTNINSTQLIVGNNYNICIVKSNYTYIVYINGNADTPVDFNNPIIATTNDLYIASYLPGGGAYSHKCIMDDIRIYNRVLTPTDVEDLYNESRF